MKRENLSKAIKLDDELSNLEDKEKEIACMMNGNLDGFRANSGHRRIDWDISMMFKYQAEASLKEALRKIHAEIIKEIEKTKQEIEEL